MPPKKKPDAGAPAKNPPKERATAPVQLSRELVEMLNVIAAHRGTSANALLTPLVRQWIVTNYGIVAREMQKRAEEIRAEG